MNYFLFMCRKKGFKKNLIWPKYFFIDNQEIKSMCTMGGKLPIESYFEKEEISWQNVLLLEQME